MTDEKRILGVMPRRIWLEKRIKELLRAIGEYTTQHEVSVEDWQRIHRWLAEVTSNMDALETERASESARLTILIKPDNTS